MGPWWAAYWAFWGLWMFIALETAGATTMGVVFRRILAGYRPTPSYRRLLARSAVSTS